MYQTRVHMYNVYSFIFISVLSVFANCKNHDVIEVHCYGVDKGKWFLSEMCSRTIWLLDSADCRTFPPRRSSLVT